MISGVYYLLTASSGFLLALAFTLLLVYPVQAAGLSPFQPVAVGTVLEITCFLGEIPTGAVEAWIADEVGEREVQHVLLRGQRLALITSIIGTLAAGALGMLAPGLPGSRAP